MSYSKLIPWFIFAVVLASIAFVFGQFFAQIPLEGNTLAMDWRINWASLAAGLPYVIAPPLVDHLPYPPWSVASLLPLGQFPMQMTWGWLTLITMMVMVISVPRARNRRLYWASVLLLALSYPAIRTIVDGNLEVLMLGGVLLVLHGYRRSNPYTLALGGLFATAKPQSFLLFLLVLGIYVLQSCPTRVWLRAGLLILGVVIPALLWRGQPWIALMLTIPQQGSIMDISLMAALRRADLFPPALNWALWLAVAAATLYVAWSSKRTFSLEKAGMLIAASLLIAPYAANTLTLLAVGVIPLFQKRRLLGGVILLLAWMQILLNRPQFLFMLAYYSTGVLLLTWVLLMWHVWRTEIHVPAPVPAAPPVMAG